MGRDDDRATALGRLVDLLVKHTSTDFINELGAEIRLSLGIDGNACRYLGPRIVLSGLERKKRDRRAEVRAILEDS